jgi:hypothetical protein
MVLEKLFEARRPFERREAGRALQPLLADPSNHPPAAGSSDRSRPAD